MTDRQTSSDVLVAPMVIEYPFSRTTGPVIGAFLTGLRERMLVGIKANDGRVIVPPIEYDPTTMAYGPRRSSSTMRPRLVSDGYRSSESS